MSNSEPPSHYGNKLVQATKSAGTRARAFEDEEPTITFIAKAVAALWND